MPTAHTEITINAPIEKVWEIMSNFENYSSWNSFIQKIAVDKIAVGGVVSLFVHFYNGKFVKSVEGITRLEAPARSTNGLMTANLEYEFLGPISTFYLVRGKRLQTIEAIDSKTTRYITHERLYGLLSFLSPIAAVQKGFETHAADLKTVCEKC